MTAEKMDIERKLQSVTDHTTETELTRLRDEIGCLSPEKIVKLRAIVEAKKGVQKETKEKLHSLLVECEANTKVPREAREKQESKESFVQVFEGAKSDILSGEHVRALKGYILSKFREVPDLSVSQRDNLAIATIDRLLSDAEFAPIVEALGGNFTSALNVLEKKSIGSVMDAFSGDRDENAETKDEVKTSMTGMMKRITDLIDRSTLPLVELLKKKPAGLSAFLSNPRAIAEYRSGNIPADIAAMSNEEKSRYVSDLNNRVLEVDGKVVSLEAFREKGMDMVATAPEWMQNIFKWLLKLPIIGNLLAGFLGYKDGSDALGLMDEELRQRRSIVTLREFGKKPGADGKETDGKYAGKISALKGMDLSGLSHKKMKDFFAFTASVGMAAVTPDQWISIFEKWELAVKGAQGKETVYKLPKALNSSDTDKDFQGVYSKLNGLLSVKNNMDYQAKQAEAKQKQLDGQAKEAQDRELAKKRAADEALAQTKTEKKTRPYRDISDGIIVSEPIVKKLSSLTLADFMDGNYRKKAEAILRGNKEIPSVLAVLKTFSDILSDPKMEGFRNNLRSGVSGRDANFSLISFQRKNMLVSYGVRVPESSPTALVQSDKSGGKREVSGKIAQAPSTTTDKSKDKPKDTRTVLAEAFTEALSFPIAFEDNGKKESVAFANNELVVGAKRFSLGVQGNGLAALGGVFSVDGVGFNGENVKLSFENRSADIPRATIAEGIGALLSLEKNARREIAGDSGKLIITRTV